MTAASPPITTVGKVFEQFPVRLVAAFAALMLGMAVAGVFFYRTQERSHRDDAREALTAVSRLKVNEISRWREDLLSDAAVLTGESYLDGNILRYLSAPTAAGQSALRSNLLVWKQHKAYTDVAVTGPDGNVKFSLSGETGPLPENEVEALQDAVSRHRTVLTDLHREPGASPHVSVAAPLFAAGGVPTPAGGVILRSDAASALYPLIVSWPTASRTAETLLVRRDGDTMLFLNELRHRSGAAFMLRVPLARRDVPSAMAGRGRTGFVQGLDYRGVPVLADIRAVPGTPWFAVTKIDLDEAMAPWRASSLQIACLVLGLLAAVSALFFALWQFRAKVQYRLLLEAGTARSATAARLAAIVDGSQDSIVATTLDGVVTAWNDGAERLLGYSAAEMTGQPIDRLASRESKADAEGILEQVRRGERIEHYEERRLTKDGRLVDMSISVSPIKDTTGRIVGLSRIGRDITEEKRIRRDLDRLRWMLTPREGLDCGEQPVPDRGCHLAERNTSRVILDAAGIPLLSEMAAGFQALVGACFSVHESNGDLAYSVVAADWCRFVHSSSVRNCAANGVCSRSCGDGASSQAMARREPADAECTGGLRLYAVPIIAGAEVVGALSMGYGEPGGGPRKMARLAEQLGVELAELERRAAGCETRPPFIVDLAKRRLLGSARLLGEIVQRRRGELLLRETRDNLARSNRELEQFAYVASHDLQEPLRMVASYTQLLAQRYGDRLDQDARDFIGYAVDGATRMKQLIEDLLAFSRVNAKGRPASIVDTRDAVSLALCNLEAAIGETKAEVSCAGLPAVLADAGQVVQLFQNLVGNAIKFHTVGVPPRVNINAGTAPDDAHRWLFRVADNGIGIDPKYFDRVFTIFQRLHTRQEYPGTGIGLALCQRIVERHGGRIWIESEPGKGAAFLFTLPAGETEEENQNHGNSQRGH